MRRKALAEAAIRSVAGRLVVAFAQRARAGRVVIGSFFHDLDEPERASEWWERPCIAFATSGSWQVRSSWGSGVVCPSVVLVGCGGAEYECDHPWGIDDRMVSIVLGAGSDVGRPGLRPHAGQFRKLGRALAGELRRRFVDAAEVEVLCHALLRTAREGQDVPPPPVAGRAQAAVAELVTAVQDRLTDPAVDLVGEAAALGLSRTRFIHAFRDTVGVSPHRYLVAARLTHAADLLRSTAMPVAEVCFGSGFGTVQSFQASFKAAYGMTPTAYRARHRPARSRAQYL